MNAMVMMQTQWRVGMGGPIGLDYTAFDVLVRNSYLRSFEQQQIDQLFDDIRVMESAALRQMRGERSDG